MKIKINQALKREFGKNFAVEVTVHNYSNEQALRGMTVENLTQKDSDLKDTAENLAVIRKFLQSSVQTLNNTRISKRGRIGEGQPSEPEQGTKIPADNVKNQKSYFEKTSIQQRIKDKTIGSGEYLP